MQSNIHIFIVSRGVSSGQGISPIEPRNLHSGSFSSFSPDIKPPPSPFPLPPSSKTLEPSLYSLPSFPLLPSPLILFPFFSPLHSFLYLFSPWPGWDGGVAWRFVVEVLVFCGGRKGDCLFGSGGLGFRGVGCVCVCVGGGGEGE